MDAHFFNAAQLCAVPALCMFMGSVVAFKTVALQNKLLLAIMQFFTAGILIAALGMKLIPKLLENCSGILGSLCILAGFSSAFALMLGLEVFVGDDDDSQDIEYGRKELLIVDTKARDASTLKKLPWGVIAPICIDSWMDGLLIGVVLMASAHAARIMVLATSIEMGFLGITFGALLKPCGWKKWPSALLAPAILIVGGAAGCGFAGMLDTNHAVFGGIIAFGTSSILYVAKELLREAGESIGKEDRHLRIWVPIGFFFIILSEKCLKTFLTTDV